MVLKDNENDIQNNHVFTHAKVDIKSCISDFNTQFCEKTTNINNNNVNIKLEKKLTANGYFGPAKIYINNKSYKFKDIYEIDAINLINDIVIIETSGTDLRSTNLIILDKNASLLKEISQLDNTGMVIFDGLDDTITFDNNVITIKGTRLYGATLINSPHLNICTDQINFGEDEILETDYKIEYLGNNNFSDITKIAGSEKKYSELLNDIIENDWCNSGVKE